jgi:hypothetical protein
LTSSKEIILDVNRYTASVGVVMSKSALLMVQSEELWFLVFTNVIVLRFVWSSTALMNSVIKTSVKGKNNKKIK